MTLAELFEDHIKLAVRANSLRPLRAGSKDIPTAASLAAELKWLEQADEFQERIRAIDDRSALEDATYAVDALIDSIGRARFGKTNWEQYKRNPDTHVGHNFYSRLSTIYAGSSRYRAQLLDLYCICEFLGFLEGSKEQKNVGEALNDAVTRSSAASCDLEWHDQAVSNRFDRQLAKMHVLLKWSLIGAASVYLAAMVYLYWIGWLGFPSTIRV